MDNLIRELADYLSKTKEINELVILGVLDIIKKHNNLQTYEEAYSKLLEYYNNQVMLLILGRVISYISENTISLYNMIKNEQI